MQAQPLREGLSRRDASDGPLGGPSHTTEELASPMEHREDMAITNDHAPTSSQTELTPVHEQGKLCTNRATLGDEHSALFGGLA